MHSLFYIFIRIVTTVKYHRKVSFPGPHISLIKSEKNQGWIVQTAKETKSRGPVTDTREQVLSEIKIV